MTVQNLPDMIGEAFDLVVNILKLSKADQKFIAAAKKSWVSELGHRAVRPQELRPPLLGLPPAW